MVDNAEIGDLWSLACKDARYVPDEGAVLYLVPGGSAEGHAALHVEPGSSVTATPGWPLAANQVRDANSRPRRDLHRVFVRDFFTPRVALGRLRHELEHAHQFDRSPGTYQAIGFVQDSLARAFDTSRPPSRSGSATLYNRLPAEEDANRAAARLTTARFGPPAEAELASTDAPLFRDEQAVEGETLALRTLAFMALFPEGVAWVAESRGEEISGLVRHLGADAPRAWDFLEGHSNLAAFGREALERCPTQDAIDATTRPPLAWAPVVERIARGRTVAEELLQSEMPDLRLD